MVNPIAESWLHSTVLIENEKGRKGTGFLVRRMMDRPMGKIFLVTNKHVIGLDHESRTKTNWFTLYLNVRDEKGKIRGDSLFVAVHGHRPTSQWPLMYREHPDPEVDVLAVDISVLWYASGATKYWPNHAWADYSQFATREKLGKFGITIGDEVMVIGYPLGLTHRETNFPLVRSGIIATRIGEEFEADVLESNGAKRKKTIRGFLVDCAMIPGSSGSPVVLRSPTKQKMEGRLGKLSRSVLVGIMAEGMYAPVTAGQYDSYSYAGLGIAFDAETIKETIELFFT